MPYDTYDTNELMYQTETDSGFENELAVARGGTVEGKEYLRSLRGTHTHCYI